jgi:hypothetical protein
VLKINEEIKHGVFNTNQESYGQCLREKKRAFVNLYAFTPEKNMYRAMPWTAKYLCIVKPRIIVCASQQCFMVFQQDAYFSCWRGVNGPLTKAFIEEDLSVSSESRILTSSRKVICLLRMTKILIKLMKTFIISATS